MKADSRTEAAVKAVLDEFSRSYEKRDLKGVLSLFASDPDCVLYGTGADEKRVGIDQIREQVERDWAQSETGSMTLVWTSISAAGPVAWVAADVKMQFRAAGQDLGLQGRATVVLEKRGDHWLIVQSHFSAPLSDQASGQSFAT